jgi:uncharacterized DUF497 family protein
MQFEWDETKSNACFTERGFDFAYVASAFADPNRMILRDERFEYGEERFQLIGRLQNRVYVVVYTLRRNVVRIISARKANLREVKRYENRANDN